MAIFPMGTPLTGASNAGGAGRNRDSEPISGFCVLLTLQQARCCQHGRRWTTATVPQVVTFLWLVVYCGYSTTIVIVAVFLQRETDQARSRTIHNYGRPWIVHVYDSKAWCYAEDNRTELNCTLRTSKSEAEVTNNKKTAFEVLYYWRNEANYRQSRSIARPLCDSRASCCL